MSKIYQYFVEGECEEKLINALKLPPICNFVPGKVEVFNFVFKSISNQRIAVLKPGTIIILVYDIDVCDASILKENIKKLNRYGFKRIIHVQSIRNFEDEIIYSSSLTNICDMYQTISYSEFKTKFIRQNNLANKLKSIGLDTNKLWSRVNKEKPFNQFSNINDLKSIKTIKK